MTDEYVLINRHGEIYCLYSHTWGNHPIDRCLVRKTAVRTYICFWRIAERAIPATEYLATRAGNLGRWPLQNVPAAQQRHNFAVTRGERRRGSYLEYLVDRLDEGTVKLHRSVSRAIALIEAIDTTFSQDPNPPTDA